MKPLRHRRWIWSPITSWQARRLSRVSGVSLDEAWIRIRLTTHPEESHLALTRDLLAKVLFTRRTE